MNNKDWVINEVQAAREKGIQVSVNGILYDFETPEEILYVVEEATYMPDYIGDEEGKIIQICFDRIND